ncbi:MAG TPA: hypothetical protein DDW73_24165 [Rhizobium sp.]|jgi:hypothetical protein|nr:hypothetical protein [Rhizobium sp.]
MSGNQWYNSPGTHGFTQTNGKNTKAFDNAKHRLAVLSLFWFSIALLSFVFWTFFSFKPDAPIIMWVGTICGTVCRVGFIILNALEGIDL